MTSARVLVAAHITTTAVVSLAAIHAAGAPPGLHRARTWSEVVSASGREALRERAPAFRAT